MQFSVHHSYFRHSFVFILYIPVNNFSVMSGMGLPGLNQYICTKQRITFLAQGHNTVTPVRLKPTAPRSRIKYSTTKPLCSHKYLNHKVNIMFIAMNH